MPSFPVDNICCRRDCGKFAEYAPVFLLRPYEDSEPAEAYFPLGFCQSCKEATTVEDLLTKEGWERICDMFKRMQKAVPMRSLLGIRWEPIQHPARTTH